MGEKANFHSGFDVTPSGCLFMAVHVCPVVDRAVGVTLVMFDESRDALHPLAEVNSGRGYEWLDKTFMMK